MKKRAYAISTGNVLIAVLSAGGLDEVVAEAFRRHVALNGPIPEADLGLITCVTREGDPEGKTMCLLTDKVLRLAGLQRGKTHDRKKQKR